MSVRIRSGGQKLKNKFAPLQEILYICMLILKSICMKKITQKELDSCKSIADVCRYVG